VAKGSVKQLAENKWRVVVTLSRNTEGKYPQIVRTVHGTKRDAEKVARRLLDEHEGQTRARGKTTLEQLLNQWLTHIEARGRSDTTIYNYRNRINHDIVLTLGKLDIRRLTVRHLDDLYTTMGKRKRGGAPASVRQVHAIIRAALNYALKRELVDRNVAALISDDLPTGSRKKIDPPTPDEVMRLLKIAWKLDKDLGMALRLSATTGARRGSIVGLRQSHVSFTDNHVIVERAITAIPGKTIRDKELKSGKGGPVPLDPETMNLLADHIAHLHQRATDAGTELVDDYYLFSTRADCATPMRPDALTTGFLQVRKTAKMPTVRLHDLRHFVPTTLMSAGFDAVTLADRLKHSSSKMTLDVYSHVVSERAKEAGDAIGLLLSQRLTATESEQ
jgi:integrase